MVASVYSPLNLPNTYRRYKKSEGKVTYSDNGSPDAITIDPSGMLVALLLTFKGTVTVATSAAQPTVLNEAPFSLLKRVTLDVGGPGKVIDASGPQLDRLERAREQGYTPSFDFAPAAGGGSDPTVTPVSFDLMVPVCVRDGDSYGEFSDYLGCIFMGAKQQAAIALQFSNSDAVFSGDPGSCTIAGTLEVFSIKLDTPEPSRDPNLLNAVSWNHLIIRQVSDFPIAGAGVLGIPDLPTARPRTYLRVLDRIAGSDGQPADGLIDSIAAQIGDTIEFERDTTEQAWLGLQNRRYGNPLPPGWYVTDFAPSNRRDTWLPVGGIDLLQIIPNANSGAASGKFNRLTECVEPSSLAAPYFQTADPHIVQAALAAGA